MFHQWTQSEKHSNLWTQVNHKEILEFHLLKTFNTSQGPNDFKFKYKNNKIEKSTNNIQNLTKD